MSEGWRSAVGGVVLALVGLWTGSASAVDIASHRGLYTMSLGSSKTDSGVTGAHGEMGYQWGETCDGWTVEQRYELSINYAEAQDVKIVSNFVTWESRDGLLYRFNQKETRNGTVNEEIRGSARLEGAGKGGTVTFEKPQAKALKLPAGTLFPSSHTMLLIDKAETGENFLSRQVFDGATIEGAVLVSAVIGARVEPDPSDSLKAPVLRLPGRRMRLAFFPADPKTEKPDYELGMLLLDNGISRDMVIDYGDYTIKAKLNKIEALGKPQC